MSYWKELEKNDLISLLKPLFDNGRLYVDYNDCKIKLRQRVMAPNVPWIFIKPAPWANCDLWHQVYFKQLGTIHSACFECFKVVLRPRTVKELFRLYNVMQDLNLPSKCGVELRDYVGELYGAYFYCQGLEHGKEVFGIVKEALDKNMEPGLPIILKRGCTEFELLHGDSRQYEQKDRDKHVEKMLEENSDIPIIAFEQPEIIKTFIKRMWLAWAYKNNDKTCLEFNDGNDFVEQPVTYHEPIEGA